MTIGVLNILCGLSIALSGTMASPLRAEDLSSASRIVVDGPWARASIGTSRPAGVYLTVRNQGADPVSLIGLRAVISGSASIHETKTNSLGISSMTSAEDIKIPAGSTIALEPGGYHAMLSQLKSPLVEGKTFPLTLLFADGSELEITVPILGLGARGPE